MKDYSHITVLEAPVKVIQPSEAFASEQLDKHEDMLYTGFTLCHEGANKKGDRFTLAELKNAWRSPVSKPLNWEHAEPNVGVILDAALKIDSTRPEDAERLTNKYSPAYIDCIGGVWKRKYPEFAKLIEKGSADASLKVSMECFFASVRYIIGDYDEVYEEADADPAIVEAKGTYLDGKYVSRELVDVLFGGAGFTEAPADKEARIWACASNKSDADYHEYLHDSYEGRLISVMNKELIIAEHEKVTKNLLLKGGE